jgi:hypothetical protein
MKIALVICPVWNIESPPLSIAYISGALKSAGHDVCCYDFSVDMIEKLPVDIKTEFTNQYLLHSWYTEFEYWRKKLLLDSFIDLLTNELMILSLINQK